MGYLIIVLVLLGLVFGPGLWVHYVLKKYSLPDDRYKGTGAELARYLLDKHGLEHVKVEPTEGGDHYDPTDKAVRLTPDKHDGRSLTAITVAAHEVGHALQDYEAYPPLKMRSTLVRLVMPIQKVGAAVLIAAPIVVALFKVPQAGLLMILAGFLTLGTSAVVHFVTLPTEFNASFARALPLLERYRILHEPDEPHARRLLKAAAMTYVSASLMSLLNIARWFAILRY
ncbi:MAG: zinc metallopeptidase [Pseudomonadota bacterium]